MKETIVEIKGQEKRTTEKGTNANAPSPPPAQDKSSAHSAAIRKVIEERKAKGLPWGRPKGSKNSKKNAPASEAAIPSNSTSPVTMQSSIDANKPPTIQNPTPLQPKVQVVANDVKTERKVTPIERYTSSEGILHQLIEKKLEGETAIDLMFYYAIRRVQSGRHALENWAKNSGWEPIILNAGFSDLTSFVRTMVTAYNNLLDDEELKSLIPHGLKKVPEV